MTTWISTEKIPADPDLLNRVFEGAIVPVERRGALSRALKSSPGASLARQADREAVP